jgi:hypothetical protein
LNPIKGRKKRGCWHNQGEREEGLLNTITGVRDELLLNRTGLWFVIEQLMLRLLYFDLDKLRYINKKKIGTEKNS